MPFMNTLLAALYLQTSGVVAARRVSRDTLFTMQRTGQLLPLIAHLDLLP